MEKNVHNNSQWSISQTLIDLSLMSQDSQQEQHSFKGFLVFKLLELQATLKKQKNQNYELIQHQLQLKQTLQKKKSEIEQLFDHNSPAKTYNGHNIDEENQSLEESASLSQIYKKRHTRDQTCILSLNTQSKFFTTVNSPMKQRSMERCSSKKTVKDNWNNFEKIEEKKTQLCRIRRQKISYDLQLSYSRVESQASVKTKQQENRFNIDLLWNQAQFDKRFLYRRQNQ